MARPRTRGQCGCEQLVPLIGRIHRRPAACNGLGLVFRMPDTRKIFKEPVCCVACGFRQYGMIMRTDHGSPVVRIEFRHEIDLSYRTHGPIRSVGAGSADCAIAKYSTSQTVKSARPVIVSLPIISRA